MEGSGWRVEGGVDGCVQGVQGAEDAEGCEVPPAKPKPNPNRNRNPNPNPNPNEVPPARPRRSRRRRAAPGEGGERGRG
eukprot:scaffold131384_cov36-Phaeocystis_antarctica.AAC.1